jgi:hypothetical protein
MSIAAVLIYWHETPRASDANKKMRAICGSFGKLYALVNEQTMPSAVAQELIERLSRWQRKA